MNFIKSVAESKVDDFAHKCFTRYGLGEYEKEPFVVSKSAGKVKLRGGLEYVNAFHGFLAHIAEGNVELKGNIVTSKEIQKELEELGIEPVEVEKLRGKSAFKYAIDVALSPDKYRKLFQKLFDCFMLFGAVDGAGRTMKVKSDKLPKIGAKKPGFAALDLPGKDYELVKKEFLFDVPESATKVEINHTYVIKDIFIPKGCENDPVLARQKAVRKGEIKRVVSVDGKIKQSTIKLEA